MDVVTGHAAVVTVATILRLVIMMLVVLGAVVIDTAAVGLLRDGIISLLLLLKGRDILRLPSLWLIRLESICLRGITRNRLNLFFICIVSILS